MLEHRSSFPRQDFATSKFIDLLPISMGAVKIQKTTSLRVPFSIWSAPTPLGIHPPPITSLPTTNRLWIDHNSCLFPEFLPGKNVVHRLFETCFLHCQCKILRTWGTVSVLVGGCFSHRFSCSFCKQGEMPTPSAIMAPSCEANQA